MWNGLPPSVVNAPSVKAFEARLDKIWKKEPFKFDLEADLPTRAIYFEPTEEDVRDDLQLDKFL
jgi:hypothetical protein